MTFEPTPRLIEAVDWPLATTSPLTEMVAVASVTVGVKVIELTEFATVVV